jgi:uncharacterized protein YqkB
MNTESRQREYRSSILEKLEGSETNTSRASNLEYNIDGCSCMGCGCFKSAWTIVLSPAGVAAGMAAYAAAVAL